MAQSNHSSNIIALGKQLVDELGLENERDTLVSWMAHNLAELLVLAAQAGAEHATELKAECRKAILEFWAHRSTLPQGKRPLGDMEPIVELLREIDPNNSLPYYFRNAHNQASKDSPDAESRQWIARAKAIDRAARELLGYCLSSAAASALDRCQDWVRLAEEAGLESEPDMVFVRILIERASENKVTEKDEISNPQIQSVKNKIQRLKFFAELSLEMEKELEDKLARITNSSEGPPPQVT